MTCRSSSLVHRSCSSGFRTLAEPLFGDRLPPLLLECDCDGRPDSDVDDTSTGDSLPVPPLPPTLFVSVSTLTMVVQSKPTTGSGVVGTDEEEVSTNLSEIEFLFK